MPAPPSPRVLIINHSADIGGTELSMEALVAGLPHSRYHFTAVLPSDGPLVARLRQHEIPLEFLPMEGWRWWVENFEQRFKFVLTLPFQALSMARWVSFLRRLKPDLIHFNINRLVEPVIAARLLHIPSVMHFRDIPSRMTYRFILGWRGFYALMNCADHWIANSSATEQDIRPFARCPVTTIPNGIDLTRFDLAARAGAVDFSSHGTFTVAMIAGLVAWKNHAGYLELARQVCARRDDVRFLVVGDGDPEYKQQLKEMAGELGVAQQVNFVGHVDNIPALLKQVDLLVHTTDREPFGRVFIEAMAARKPVVAFNSGGAADVVANGETGILVSSGDVNAMAEAVCRLLDAPALRNQMGDAGRKRVEQHYLLEKHCSAVAAVYTHVLYSRARRVGAAHPVQQDNRS